MNTKNLDLSKSKILVNSENLLSDVNLLAVQLKNKFQDELLYSLVLKGGKTLFNLISNTLGNNLIEIPINLSKIESSYDFDSDCFSNEKINNKNVLLIDGIIISGMTHLNLMKKIVKHNPKSISLVSLAKKKGHANFEKMSLYTIYTFNKEFVAGCGIGEPPFSDSHSLYDLS
ncbi:hypothetical protein IDH10_03000 [Pelagibacterales bacterium SAG-MED20]|nr:hypothetical protein [Pelagibacterales bacterium SAG-MED20]